MKLETMITSVLMALVLAGCARESYDDSEVMEPQDYTKGDVIKRIGKVPKPDEIKILRPHVVAYPGDDVNEVVREHAVSNKLFVLGIAGKHDESLRLCKKYGAHTRDDGKLIIQVVGVKTDVPAEIRGIHLYGQKGTVKSAEFHNLRVSTSRGARSPILDVDKSERLVFNNLELYPDPDNLGNYGGAGMKWGFDLQDGTDYLHINNCRRGSGPRGKERFEEHWAYLKSTGALFITNNDIGGGNRTGFQVRAPGQGEPPHGPIVISNNVAEDYGWDWNFNNGGSCITIWGSLKYPVYILNNRILNAKYGCVSITQEPQDQEPPLLNNGRAHSNVVLLGNSFSNTVGDRACVSISSTTLARVLENRIDGSEQADIVIDSKTAWKWGALPCVRVHILKSLKDSLKIIQWNGQSYIAWK